MSADPTLDILRKFNDPSAWAAVRYGVPIFIPHERATKNPDGTPGKIVVTEDDLKAIAAKAQKLEAESGVPLRMTVGHIDPKASESAQPVLAGYTRNLRFGHFGPKNTPAILNDQYFLHEHYAVAKDCLYRSPEFYPGSGEIRGVALLKRDPFLDMGVVTYDSRGACHTYALGDEMPQEQEQGDELQGQDRETAEKYMRHYAKCHPWVAYAMKCHEGGAAMGPTNGGTAAPMPEGTPVPDAQRMQNDQLATQYARIEADNKSLRSEVADLRTERDRERCERMVMQLESEGYQLDRATEVDDLLGRPADKRSGRIDYLRKFMKRGDPVTAPVPYSADGTVPVADAESPRSNGVHAEPKGYEQVMQYMRGHPGMSYQEAKLALMTPA